MLEVSGICKSYGKHRILNGVSFSAGPGQCVGIVGTNGCGKTTLLSILAGALQLQTAGASASMGPRSWEGPGLPQTLRPMFPRRTR